MFSKTGRKRPGSVIYTKIIHGESDVKYFFYFFSNLPQRRRRHPAAGAVGEAYEAPLAYRLSDLQFRSLVGGEQGLAA